MSVIEPATVGHLLSCAVFVALVVRVMRQSGPRHVFRALWVAGMAGALWSITAILAASGTFSGNNLFMAVSWTRNLAWLLVLLLAVAEVRSIHSQSKEVRRNSWTWIAAGIVIGIIIVWQISAQDIPLQQILGVLISLAAFGFFETIIGNSPRQFRPFAAYICIAAAGIFLPTLIAGLPLGVPQQAHGLLEAAGGYVAAIATLPLVIALRTPVRPIESELVNRRFVYRPLLFVTLTTAILGLVVLDNYVRSLGGSWSGVLRTAFVASVACLLVVSIFSPSVRGQIRVFLTKSFLRYKYDYRKEWLRFIGTLSETGLDHLSNTAVRAIARIVNSPAGVVWVVDADSKRYTPIGAWQCSLPLEKTFSSDSSLAKFLRDRQWVTDLSEMQRYPSMYGDLEVDEWFMEDEKWWIIVPLLLGNELYGFVALQHALTISSLNFEDHDLLRTVGRHVATHLKQAESDKKLSEAQQFSTYHRLSAFLMHDLNNLAAQLSLVVKNAKKHKDDPKFIDDMIATAANSATRMNRLLEQLSDVTIQARAADLDLVSLLKKSIAQSRGWRPIPKIHFEGATLLVTADADRLGGVFEHLIRNAQDATDDAGSIDVEVEQEGQWVIIKIRDSGCGMTDDFVNERLFRPFDSTKGSQSMGIGAYQAREYIRELGGQIDVVSSRGSGSTFTIHLPVSPQSVPQELQ